MGALRAKAKITFSSLMRRGGRTGRWHLYLRKQRLTGDTIAPESSKQEVDDRDPEVVLSIQGYKFLPLVQSATFSRHCLAKLNWISFGRICQQ